jgi:hypothetical protein
MKRDVLYATFVLALSLLLSPLPARAMDINLGMKGNSTVIPMLYESRRIPSSEPSSPPYGTTDGAPARAPVARSPWPARCFSCPTARCCSCTPPNGGTDQAATAPVDLQLPGFQRRSVAGVLHGGGIGYNFSRLPVPVPALLASGRRVERLFFTISRRTR